MTWGQARGSGHTLAGRWAQGPMHSALFHGQIYVLTVCLLLVLLIE